MVSYRYKFIRTQIGRFSFHISDVDTVIYFFIDLPTFEVLGISRSGIPEIKVGFQSGLNHDMVLQPYSSSACNFIGELKNVPDSSVAVTGCLDKPGDKMHITMISPIEAKSSIFELDFDGQVTALENPQKYQEGINTIFILF